jgi:uncharacterized RDD family membrane protein YckC
VAKLVLNPTSSNRREIALSSAMILTIGRDPSNDLVLPDAMVSRRHAVVEHRAGQFFLRDCSSANGSVVNGDRVSERGLRDGDLVAIGSTRLLFREDLPEGIGEGKVVPHPSAAPLQCPSCKADYRRGDLFCRECGQQVAQPSGPPRTVCTSCGATVKLPARFCSACGKGLSPDGERVEMPTPAFGQPASTAPLVSPQEEADAAQAQGSMAVVPVRQPDATPVPLDWASAATPPPAPQRVAPRRERRPPPRENERRAATTTAPFGSRLAAGLVDAVFVLSGQLVLLAPVAWYWWTLSAPAAPADVAYLPVLVSAILVSLALVAGALYHVYFWSVKGATPGKELLSLRVETEDGVTPLPLGRAALRVLGYLLSAASLGAGFLMIAFGGAGLHDRIARTRVVAGQIR